MTRRLLSRALVQRSFLELWTGSPAADAPAVARQAIDLFEEVGDELGLARAWMLLGFLEWRICRAEATVAAYEEAAGHAGRAGAQREEEESLIYVAGATAFGPTPAPEAIARCKRLLADAP